MAFLFSTSRSWCIAFSGIDCNGDRQTMIFGKCRNQISISTESNISFMSKSMFNYEINANNAAHWHRRCGERKTLFFFLECLFLLLNRAVNAINSLRVFDYRIAFMHFECFRFIRKCGHFRITQSNIFHSIVFHYSRRHLYKRIWPRSKGQRKERHSTELLPFGRRLR